MGGLIDYHADRRQTDEQSNRETKKKDGQTDNHIYKSANRHFGCDGFPFCCHGSTVTYQLDGRRDASAHVHTHTHACICIFLYTLQTNDLFYLII